MADLRAEVPATSAGINLQAASLEICFVAFSAIDALWHPVTIIFTRRTFQTSSEHLLVLI